MRLHVQHAKSNLEDQRFRRFARTQTADLSGGDTDERCAPALGVKINARHTTAMTTTDRMELCMIQEYAWPRRFHVVARCHGIVMDAGVPRCQC